MMRYRSHLTWIFILFAITATACGGGNTSSNGASGGGAAGATEREQLLSDVQSWGYQLQNMDVNDIADSAYDLMVIDFSADGSEAEAFSANDVETMRGSGANEKLMIAYMSIGEAEDYRDYFDINAGYIEGENPDWPGNYKVYYWQDEWQAVVDDYLDQIVAAGFDGVYLDIIDAYEYFGPDGDSGLDRDSAADDMVDLVTHIAERARSTNENFLVIPQNGAFIIEDSTLGSDYLDAIDAIGVEDTFYFGDNDEDNPLDPQNEIIGLLPDYIAENKVVLAIDYLNDPDLIDDFYARAETEGYIPYSSIRDLDALTVNAGHEPD